MMVMYRVTAVRQLQAAVYQYAVVLVIVLQQPKAIKRHARIYSTASREHQLHGGIRGCQGKPVHRQPDINLCLHPIAMPSVFVIS